MISQAINTSLSHVEVDADLELEYHELEVLGLLKYLRPDSMKKNDLPTHSNQPLRFWTPYIDAYVQELLCLEGRGDAACQQELTSHQLLPFHRVEQWNGDFFVKTSLKSLGLVIQLNHLDGVCTNPATAFNNDFVIIDSNGIHEVALNYCACSGQVPQTTQLLRARLFPSTVVDPKTAATFDVLERFQLLSFTSKISAYKFYRSLSRLTDNTGVTTPKERYTPFMRILREWRHVRLLKRMGRGHDESGVRGTRKGECAVLCPACPHPGINLPDNWRDQPANRQWLYSLFIGLDANFRLKRMNVSSDLRDPGLNHGYAYLVDHAEFQAYLDTYGEKIPDDKSTCNNHDAIKSASARGGNGTAASGSGLAECTRHDMKRPCAVGDLQKGERYVNMDYFFLTSLANCEPARLVVSYDIACQWAKNLASCCEVYPPNILSTQKDLEVVYLVPKFHLPAHIQVCQENFSFNFIPGVGRTDGESPERGWAAANAVANSTREMGPGLRRDVLDDHFGDYNWRKIMNIVSTFARRAKEALAMREEHVDAFVEFDGALPVDLAVAWTDMCKTWESNRAKHPNPFHAPKTVVTDSEVRLRLANEDKEALANGTAMAVHDDMTPSQRRHAQDVATLGIHATDLQKAKVLEHANSLSQKIDAWISIQHLYMPTVALLRTRQASNISTPVAVQEIRLLLPSSLPRGVLTDVRFFRYEWQFRYAQAEEELNTLRGHLLLRSHMLKSKSRYSRGQRQNTRSQKLLSDVDAKIQASTGKYRLIRQALESLSGPLLEVTWKDVLRPLDESHVTGLSSMDDTGSEGRKKLSWIWKVHGTGADADECTQFALRIEWCKARARAHRWQEECVLLAEEMRRVYLFSSGKASGGDHALRLKIRDDIWHKCEQEWKEYREKLVTMDGRDAYTMVECH
ncbi:hypothetical protein NLJ89_g8461 [Agrocybe chaxingu]|uniref:CxC2-like cysteine cluster KDZ transposase-associated domain-containing protein n=1 Tax=Agrocybe chaxingu TaxID=84603 RepID=A0A9W8JV75_9AGAR|nr:hypothetical protein NLJ89_g8461 [Agrocybe chaxingu]